MTGYCSCGEIKQRCHVCTASHSGNWVLVSKSNIFLKPASEYYFGIPRCICAKPDTIVPSHKRKFSSPREVWKTVTVDKQYTFLYFFDPLGT